MPSDWNEIDRGLTDGTWYRHGERHAEFKRLRDGDPVHWAETGSYGRDFWVLTRHEDIAAVLSDPIYYSSSLDSRLPREGRRYSTVERRALGQDSQITLMDPPMHTKHRQPINKHFSVPALARLTDTIEAVGDQLVAKMKQSGQCDFVEIAGDIPMYVVLDFLGAPREEWPYLRETVLRRFFPADPAYAVEGKTTRDVYIDAQSALHEYAKQLAIKRRAEPRDDFATVITQMTVDGTPLDDEEIATWCMLVIIGGLESTRNAIVVGTWLLLQQRQQRELLLSEPGLIRSAVEEILRWTTPSRVRLRVARANTELREKKINAGDWVVSFLASANKDERVYDDPHTFDITRKPNDHFAFGHGIHLCLGRALARLEMASFIPKVLRAFPDLHVVDDAEPRWIEDFMVTGFTRLDLGYTPN